MTDTRASPQPYRVVYSERVRQGLRDLIARAKARGLGKSLLDGLKQLDERPRIYPQAGQPLRDLTLEPAQVWVATFPPLVVQYVLDEERRLVMVVVPILPLPNTNLGPEAPPIP
jgi:hypothetical protein